MRTFWVILLSSLSFPSLAWIGYHGGGFIHGPHGGTAAWHRGGWGGAYYHGGCWGCVNNAGAIAAAGAVGLATGAALGVAASADRPPIVVQQPIYLAAPAIGSTVVSLPAACNSAIVSGMRYYRCGGVYYQPHFGNNSVYYSVVPNPF